MVSRQTGEDSWTYVIIAEEEAATDQEKLQIQAVQEKSSAKGLGFRGKGKGLTKPFYPRAEPYGPFLYARGKGKGKGKGKGLW